MRFNTRGERRFAHLVCSRFTDNETLSFMKPRSGCWGMESWEGEVGSVCLHPSISAAEIKVLRFLAERMRNLVSTPLDVYAFVSARLGNTEPETETRTSPSDARRDKPPRSPRRSASAPDAPRLWPTPRDLRARNPLLQNAVRTAQSANAPAVGPGRSLLTCWRAGFARAHQFHAAFGC